MGYSARQLIKGTSIYTLSKLFTKAGTIILLPFFTRLLTPDEYAIIGLLNPIISFIPLFFVFGLYVAQMRNYVIYKDNTKILGSYIFSLNVFLLVMIIIVFSFFISPYGKLLIGKIINLKSISFYPYILISFIIGFLGVFNLMAQNYFQAIKSFKKVGLSSVISFIVSSVISLTLIYWFNLGALGKIIGRLFGSIFIFSSLYLQYIRVFKFRFKSIMLKDSLILGMPIVINAVLGTIINFSDRLVMAKYMPLNIVGIYSLAYTGGMLLSFFINSFNEAWRPMLYNLLESNENDKYIIIKKIYLNYIVLIVFIALIGQLFGKEVITFLLPDSYKGAIRFLPYILTGMVINGVYHYAVNIIVYHKDTKVIPLFSLLSAATNLGVNIIFIPKFGPLVAAISTIISYGLTSIGLLMYIKFKYRYYTLGFIRTFLIVFFTANPLLIYILNLNISINVLIFKIAYICIFVLMFGKNIYCFLIDTAKKKYNR